MDAYCISLQKNQDTWPGLLDYIKNQGIENIQIFPAVVGKDLPNKGSEEYEKFGDPRKYLSLLTYFNLIKKNARRFHHQNTQWGSVGCYLSHFLLWSKLVDDPNLQSMLIFEDDIEFNSSFADTFKNQILPNIPSNSDVVFLDTCRIKKKTVPYNTYFNRIVSLFFGTHAYIITKQGAINFLKQIFPIEMQLDSYMAKYAEINDLYLYVSAKKICSQRNHASSVQDGLQIIMWLCDYWQLCVIFIIIVVVLSIVGLLRRKS
jgi:GR25 family glycosyltransferase involved in LPS biosynthesis